MRNNKPAAIWPSPWSSLKNGRFESILAPGCSLTRARTSETRWKGNTTAMARPKNTPLDPPTGLDRVSRKRWNLTIEQLVGQGTWADSDVPLLERYVRALEVGRLARARIAGRAKRNPSEAYTTRGSQGQLVQHPDLTTAREAERDANDYATDLLLTSRARRQHDIQPKRLGASRLSSIIGTGGARESTGA